MSAASTVMIDDIGHLQDIRRQQTGTGDKSERGDNSRDHGIDSRFPSSFLFVLPSYYLR